MFLGLLGNKQIILKMTETVVESSDITDQARLQPPAPESRLEPSDVYQVVLQNPSLCGLNWIHSQTTELLVKNPVFTIFKKNIPDLYMTILPI